MAPRGARLGAKGANHTRARRLVKHRCRPSIKCRERGTERAGFEPAVPFWGTHDFPSCTFGHSVTSPGCQSHSRVHELASSSPRLEGGRPEGRAKHCTIPVESRERRALESPRGARSRPCVTVFSGEHGLRTHGPVPGTLDFESSAFDHSASSPPRVVAKGVFLSTASSQRAAEEQEEAEKERPRCCLRRLDRAARAAAARWRGPP